MSINFETNQNIPPPNNTRKIKRLARNSRLFRIKAIPSTSAKANQAPAKQQAHTKKHFNKSQRRKAKFNQRKMLGSSSASATKAGPSSSSSSSYQPSKHLVRQRNNNNSSRFNQNNRNIHMQTSNNSNHSNQFQNKSNNNNNFNRFLKSKSFKNKQNLVQQQQQHIQPHSQQQPQYSDSSAQSNSSYSLINNNNNNSKFQSSSQHVMQQQHQPQFINPFKFIQSKPPIQQQQFISNAAAFFQLIRNEFTFNITNDDHRSASTNNIINDKNQQISQLNRQASTKQQLHSNFKNYNMINQMNGDQQMKQQVIHSKLLPKFKYFKFGAAVQPGKKTKNTAPYNTTQYIMYDYSKRLSKEQVCPNGQTQFSNDWNMALAATADSNKLANFNSPIYINNYTNSSSDAHENDMDFLEELSAVVETKATVDHVSETAPIGAYKRSKSIEIINVSKDSCAKMDEEDMVDDSSKALDILSSSF